jgi:hypothetical protein
MFYIRTRLDLLKTANAAYKEARTKTTTMATPAAEQNQKATAADIVHLYTFCITYNKDLDNRGYLFTLWRISRR